MKKKLISLIIIPNLLFFGVIIIFLFISRNMNKQIIVGDKADKMRRSVRLLGDEFRSVFHNEVESKEWIAHYEKTLLDLEQIKSNEDTVGHNLIHDLENNLFNLKKQFDLMSKDREKYFHKESVADRIVEPMVRDTIDAAYRLSLAESEAVRLGNHYINIVLITSMIVVIVLTSFSAIFITKSINDEMVSLTKMEQKLKSSNEDLSRFAYFLSHDLKEPARMVSSYLDMVKNKSVGVLEDKTLKWIDFSIDGAKRMEALIESLLNYSRLDSQLSVRNVEICHEVVNVALQNLQPLIVESNAKITFRCDNPVWDSKRDIHEECWHCKVKCDPISMIQMFQNLISNAIKYAQPGISPIINMLVTHRDGAMIFSIKDNGIGIRVEDIPNLFQIFKRLHPRDMYPGNGIGLASCKKIMDRHGGRIWVESQLGVGSTFYFMIPSQASTRIPF